MTNHDNKPIRRRATRAKMLPNGNPRFGKGTTHLASADPASSGAAGFAVRELAAAAAASTAVPVPLLAYSFAERLSCPDPECGFR